MNTQIKSYLIIGIAWLSLALGFVFLALLLINCNVATGATEIDASVQDAGGTEMDYPNGNYGFKPIVRKSGKKFITDSGDVLEPFFLPNNHGVLVTHEDLFDLEFDLLIILVSVKDCPPCYDAYAGLIDLQIYFWDKGYKAYICTVIGDADSKYLNKIYAEYNGTFLRDEDKSGFVSPWEKDRWPDQIRGFPSFVFVDGRTMEILTDALGFKNSESWMDEQWTKILLAQNAQKKGDKK